MKDITLVTIVSALILIGNYILFYLTQKLRNQIHEYCDTITEMKIEINKDKTE